MRITLSTSSAGLQHKKKWCLKQGDVCDNWKDGIESRNTTGRKFSGDPGRVVRLCASSTGHLGSVSGRGTRIPHAMKQIGPCAITTARVPLESP